MLHALARIAQISEQLALLGHKLLNLSRLLARRVFPQVIGQLVHQPGEFLQLLRFHLQRLGSDGLHFVQGHAHEVSHLGMDESVETDFL